MTTITTEGITAGMIFVSTWGYEQTNVEFLRVVRVTPKTVLVEPVGTHREDGDAWMTYWATPSTQATGEPMRRKVTRSRAGAVSITGMRDFTCAQPWDGQPVQGSSYA